MINSDVKRKVGRPKGVKNRVKKIEKLLVKKAKNNTKGTGTPLFKKGNSPRSLGRPPGSRNKSKIILDTIGLNNAAAVYNKLVDLALGRTKEGDINACKIILDRVYPIQKGRNIDLEFDSYPINTMQDVNKLSEHIITMLITGEISAEEAQDYSKALEGRMKIITDTDIVDKINKTYQKIDEKKDR